jgi:hypothetical protein
VLLSPVHIPGCRLAAPTESACARSGVANVSHHAPADRPRSLNARFGVLRAALCDMPLYPWVCRSDVSKERSDLMSVSPRGITHISWKAPRCLLLLLDIPFCVNGYSADGVRVLGRNVLSVLVSVVE